MSQFEKDKPDKLDELDEPLEELQLRGEPFASPLVALLNLVSRVGLMGAILLFIVLGSLAIPVFIAMTMMFIFENTRSSRFDETLDDDDENG